jgi:hypothetical protein
MLAFASNATAAPSTQAAPNVACWKRLLNDWYDGRIDRAYPLRCYREAIANLPEDVKVYADAEADIRRAMLAAVRQSKKDTGKQPTAATPVKPPSQPTPPSNPPPPPSPPAGGAKAPAPGVDPNNPDDGVIAVPETITTGATRSSDTLPLPLLVLGALALLLLAAAGAGVVNKRLQARRIPATPPTEEPPPVV